MNRICLVLAGCLAMTNAWLPAQQAEVSPSPGPHQIALIDMGHVFQHYEKFTTLTQSLQQEIQETDEKAKGLIARIRAAQEQLAGLKEGAPQFDAAEAEMLQAQRELEQFKRTAQRDFLRKEADIYKTVYLEVEDAVNQYAGYYHFSLVLRFERQKVEEADDPRQILNGMNRQVVYFRAQDDITDAILQHLNQTWKSRQPTARPRAVAP